MDLQSLIVAFGYALRPLHEAPTKSKLPHVRAMFNGVRVQSAFGQKPSFDSDD